MTPPITPQTQQSARIYFRDGRVSEFKDQQLAYQTWLSLPRGTRAAFRGKGDNARSMRGITRTNHNERKTTMGLTIHYSFKARGSDAQARKLINALHQTAQDLPFKELGQVVELSGEQCDLNNRDREDPLRWLLIQAPESVEFISQRQ